MPIVMEKDGETREIETAGQLEEALSDGWERTSIDPTILGDHRASDTDAALIARIDELETQALDAQEKLEAQATQITELTGRLDKLEAAPAKTPAAPKTGGGATK